MVLIILVGLNLNSKDLDELSINEEQPSILWQACDAEHVRLAAHILEVYGEDTRDNPGPDGTTAFTMALARLNVELVKTLVQSAAFQSIVRREKNENQESFHLRIIADFLCLTSDQCKPMQEALYVLTAQLLHNTISNQSTYQDNEITPEYPANIYPHVNEKSEFICGHLNQKSQEEILSLRKNHTITLAECEQYILGDFCIQSPSETWAISKDLILLPECQHISKERYLKLYFNVSMGRNYINI